PVPAVVVGALLMLIAFAAVCIVVARRPDRLTLLTGLVILSVAFFVLPTRVHERYLFPFIAVGAILAAFSWRWRAAYVVLSLTMFLNMYVVLTTLYPDNPGISDWLGIGAAIRGPGGVTIVALTTLVAALWTFVQLRPAAERRLRRDLVDSAIDHEVLEDDLGVAARDARPETDGPAFPVGWAQPAPRVGSAPLRATRVSTFARSTAAEPAAPTWTSPPSFVELGPWGWFRAKLAERPVRADRSRGLHDEPGGRFDRLDLWLLTVLVVSILGIRMFRLSEPYQMHFDEVYHARTATEFLQDWRYGISHDIYEWTHPHLAKYAMAAGLVVLGDDQVSATSELGVPVLDAVIEPRHDDPTMPNGRAGDRVDIVTGSELRSYDLLSRNLVATIPIDGARAVAFDATASELFVGSSDGSITTVDVASLDAARSPSTSTPVAEAVAFGHVDGEIKRLFVPDDGGSLLVATADDRLTALDATSAEVLGTTQLDGIADLAPGGTSPTLVGSPGAVANPTAAASTIAQLLGGTAATYQQRLAGTADRITVAGISSTDLRDKVQAAIDDGRLAGLRIESLPQVAVADAKGVQLIDPATGQLTATVSIGGPAHGLALTTVDDSKLYVTTEPDAGTTAKG
ncbi:MAG TPA: hypothetical protein VIM24_00995, partial [Candidatus Limnocylindrales bacterium]